MRILVVEDEESIAEVIHYYLTEEQYDVDIAYDGEAGNDLTLQREYDLIIADIMLPKLGGKELCRMWRGRGVMTPILMLTALASADDIISGLDIGADDYLTKPFSLPVLLARVRMLTRSKFVQKPTELRVADLVLDIASRTVARDGQPAHLTAQEYTLLEYLMVNKGRVLTYQAITEHVWDMHYDPHSNVLASLIKCIRRKIDRDYPVQLIHTIRGVGYRIDD